MNWVHIAWPMMAGACFAIALGSLHVGLKQPRQPAYLAFAGLTLSLATLVIAELLLMRAATPAEFGTVMRWAHVPVFTLVVSIVLFIRISLQAGWLWLAWAACGVRLLSLVLNFLMEPNLNYREITGLHQLELFAGATASVATGVPNPWSRVAELSSLLLVLFIASASITCWRRGTPLERHRAASIGGSIGLMVIFVGIHAALIHTGVIQSIYLHSILFLAVVIIVSVELSEETIRSARLSTQLMESEASVRRSERRMDMAADAAGVGTWEWDIVRNDVWMSGRGRALFGFAASEKIDLDRFLAALHPDEQGNVRMAIAQSRETGGSFEREYRVLLPDNELRWTRSCGSVEAGPDGRPSCIRGVSFDITERKKAEERLQHERAFLRQVIDIVPTLIFAKDPSGRFTLANQAVAELYGTTVDSLIGHDDGRFNPSRREVEAFRRDDLEVITTLRERVIAEEPITDCAGRTRWLHTIKRPIVASDGTANQVLGSAVDITARKQSELELAALRNELAHLSRVTMLSELSGSLAHELNQPLAAILSNAQAALRFLAGSEPDISEVREILQDIVSDDRRAGEVIQGLRLLLKKGELRLGPLDVNEVMHDVMRLMHSDLLNSGVGLRTRFAPDLPQVVGDRVQLQQVVLNLVVNGCDAMAGNKPAERQLVVSTDTDRDGVRISVADSGCGIPPDGLERVFEAFFTTKAQGLGLGLSVCRSIIAAHGGRLWAANNSTRGASFFVALPRVGSAMA